AALEVSLAPTLNYYLFTLSVVTAALWTLWRVSRSPLGLVLAAIRENPSRPAYLGIPTRRYRRAAFTIAGASSGRTWALFAPFRGTVVPDFANWEMSAEPVLMTLLPEGPLGLLDRLFTPRASDMTTRTPTAVEDRA